MPTYLGTFKNLPVGVEPTAPPGFTRIAFGDGNQEAAFHVRDDFEGATDGRTLGMRIPGGGFNGIYPDDLGEFEEGQFLARLRFGGSGAQFRLFGRGEPWQSGQSWSSGLAPYAHVTLWRWGSTDQLAVAENVGSGAGSGQEAMVAPGGNGYHFPPEWLLLRYELRDGLMRAKVWVEGDEEPAWQVSKDINLLPATPGRWGLGHAASGSMTNMDQLAEADYLSFAATGDVPVPGPQVRRLWTDVDIPSWEGLPVGSTLVRQAEGLAWVPPEA